MQKPLGLYLHIPYCQARCAYCDFNTYAGSDRQLQAAYVRALLAEMDLYAPRFHGRRFATFFIGGGTPSLLPAEMLEQILRHAIACFDFLPGPEVTVECNPGTIDVEGDKLERLLGAGANRPSFGVQAYQERLLRRLGRIHGAAEAEQAVKKAQAAGFANVNVDLMYGLPEQTLEDWEETLAWAISLGTQHISAYSLIVEEGTPYFLEYQRGTLTLPSEPAEEEMYETAVSTLAAAGFEQYEVSNYARQGFRSRHNQVYWRNEEYLGLGAGAHSYLDGRRFWNIRLPARYEEAVLGGRAPVADGEELDRAGQMAETVIMHLRMNEGLPVRAFAERFGQPPDAVYGDVARRLVGQGLLEMTPEAWRLSRQGLKLGNLVWQAFLP